MGYPQDFGPDSGLLAKGSTAFKWKLCGHGLKSGVKSFIYGEASKPYSSY